jgi:2-oxoisovalerate dehydrogenase E1 component
LVSSGSDLTIVTYGLGVHWAKEEMSQRPEIEADIIDLRSLIPLDTETVYTSVRKTGRAIVLHEDCITGGIGGELTALITEHCFEALDAPVRRVGSLNSPVPFAASIESIFLPQERFKAAVDAVLHY